MSTFTAKRVDVHLRSHSQQKLIGYFAIGLREFISPPPPSRVLSLSLPRELQVLLLQGCQENILLDDREIRQSTGLQIVIPAPHPSFLLDVIVLQFELRILNRKPLPEKLRRSVQCVT